MQGRLIVGTWLRLPHRPATKFRRQELRLMVTKPPTRAAVHGIRLSVTDTLNVGSLLSMYKARLLLSTYVGIYRSISNIHNNNNNLL
jgi:hypothetical protein